MHIKQDENNGIMQRILSFGKEKDLGEYNRKLLNRIWGSKRQRMGNGKLI